MLIHGDYRQILQSEFERRTATHRQYSLRAFARDLGLSAPRMSEVLAGKKGLSRQAAEKIASRLGLSQTEVETFCDLVDARHARAKLHRESAQARLATSAVPMKTHTLDLDTFQMLSDWHHFAILQLLETTGFKNDAKWIANRLAISPVQASSALERLKRMGLLKEEKGRLKASKEFVSTPNVPSAAIRENHRQIRMKAIDAIENQPIESRDFSSLQLPVDSRDLAKAKKRIQEFRRAFCSEFSRAKNKDGVYCLSIDFFSLTRTKED